MKITVLIPLFNRIRFIKEAVDSVLTQNVDQLELLIIDDGSSDGSYEFARQCEASNDNVTVLTHPKRQNRGQAASLNLGIANAKGQFIAILDSDDVFEKGKLEIQLNEFNADPELGCVYGRGLAIDAEGKALYYTLPEEHEETGDPNRLLLDCYIAIPGGALMRSEVVDATGGFDETLRAGQDHDFALKVFENCKVKFVNHVAFHYRMHEDTISQKGLRRRWENAFVIARNAASRYPYSSSTIRKRKAVIHFRLGQVKWSESKAIFSTLHHMIQAVLLDPARAIKVLFTGEK